jgi:hypothetical protein
VGAALHKTVELGEGLAHNYAWESYHSELNRTGSARVPSQPFSAHFDLRGVAQSFDQVLPDGSRATITLRGVDGLDGDIVYVREDLLRQYVGDRAVVWDAFGERELRPYPPSPPEWLPEAVRRRENAWNQVLTEKDLTPPAPRARGPRSTAAPERGGSKTGGKVRSGVAKKRSKPGAKKSSKPGAKKSSKSGAKSKPGPKRKPGARRKSPSKDQTPRQKIR